MPIRIKNEEWVEMKQKVLKAFEIFCDESDKIGIPLDEDDFEVIVDECRVHPTFVKKGDYMKVEYDSTLCNIGVRIMSVYLFNDVVRLEFTLKN